MDPAASPGLRLCHDFKASIIHNYQDVLAQIGNAKVAEALLFKQGSSSHSFCNQLCVYSLSLRRRVVGLMNLLSWSGCSAEGLPMLLTERKL